MFSVVVKSKLRKRLNAMSAGIRSHIGVMLTIRVPVIYINFIIVVLTFALRRGLICICRKTSTVCRVRPCYGSLQYRRKPSYTTVNCRFSSLISNNIFFISLLLQCSFYENISRREKVTSHRVLVIASLLLNENKYVIHINWKF